MTDAFTMALEMGDKPSLRRLYNFSRDCVARSQAQTGALLLQIVVLETELARLRRPETTKTDLGSIMKSIKQNTVRTVSALKEKPKSGQAINLDLD